MTPVMAGSLGVTAAQLAGYDTQLLDDLRGLTTTESAVLGELWRNIGQAQGAVEETLEEARSQAPPAQKELTEQFLILVECGSEEEQVKLLQQFQNDGLKCRALLS